MGAMNKRELAKAVAVQADVELKTVIGVIDGFTDVVTAVVSKGEPISIPGFAKFVKVDRPARMGRNPATGEAIRIKASKKARITPVKAFKDAVLAPAKAPKLVKGVVPDRRRGRRRRRQVRRGGGRQGAGSQAPTKKAPARKTAARKAAARKAPAKRSTARKAPAKRSTAREGTGQEGREAVAGTPGAEPLADRPLSEPHHDRLSANDPAYQEIIRAHDAALRIGADTYIDPSSGLVVLTADTLARRGSCCASGCRHCPYCRESASGLLRRATGPAPISSRLHSAQTERSRHERHRTGSRMVVGI